MRGLCGVCGSAFGVLGAPGRGELAGTGLAFSGFGVDGVPTGVNGAGLVGVDGVPTGGLVGVPGPGSAGGAGGSSPPEPGGGGGGGQPWAKASAGARSASAAATERWIFIGEGGLRAAAVAPSAQGAGTTGGDR